MSIKLGRKWLGIFDLANRDKKSRPGKADLYSCPNLFYDDYRSYRANWRKVLPSIVRDESWNALNVPAPNLDFDDIASPVIVFNNRPVDFGKVVYLCDVITALEPACRRLVKTPEDQKRVLEKLLIEGSEYTWFVISMSYLTPLLGADDLFNHDERKAIYQKLLIAKLRFWDQLEWLSDMITTDYGVTRGWRAWSPNVACLLIKLGIPDDEVMSIYKLSPKVAKSEVLKMMARTEKAAVSNFKRFDE